MTSVFFFSLPDDIRLPFPFFNLNYIGKPTCKNRKSREAVMPLLASSLSLSLHFITGGCRVLNWILKNYARLHHERTVQRMNQELRLDSDNSNNSGAFPRTSPPRGGTGSRSTDPMPRPPLVARCPPL